MEKPLLILAEDYRCLRKEYVKNLVRVGFSVASVKNGREFYDLLHRKKFDLIVSDSDLPYIHGDEVCRIALEEKVVSEDVLIVGMSDCEDRQKYWRGIANIGCFYNKANLSEGRIGEKVLQAWRLFNQGGFWRAKMPLFNEED